jgi:hypothetical protein
MRNKKPKLQNNFVIIILFLFLTRDHYLAFDFRIEFISKASIEVTTRFQANT